MPPTIDREKGSNAETMSDKPEPKSLEVQRVELLDVKETFADTIDSVYFDGQTLRINFAVTRVDASGSQARAARRYPSSRMVLTTGAAVDLMNQLQKLSAALLQAGVLKATPPPSA